MRAARPAASEVAIDCACDASIAAPFACAIASLRLLSCLSCAACSWRTASASRVRASGPMLPRRTSMKSDTARTLRLRSEERLIVGAAEPLGRLAFLGDAGQQPVQLGVGLGQLGERAQRICGAGALRVGDGPDRHIPGGAELVGLRDVAPSQLVCRGLDAVLNVGDRRREGGDRAVDIGCGGVHRIQQRARLTQRRLRRADGIDEPALAIRRAREQAPRVGDVLLGEGQSLLGRIDVAGHGSQCGIGELVVQRGKRLLRRFQSRRQVDHLLGHRIQPGGRVDDQVAQLRERFPLGVEFAVGLGRRHEYARQQVTSLGGRLRNGVVEDLTHVECLRQCRFRVQGRPC